MAALGACEGINNGAELEQSATEMPHKPSSSDIALYLEMLHSICCTGEREDEVFNQRALYFCMFVFLTGNL